MHSSRKCASYLQQAIGLIVVDLVTNRKADLHAELIQRVTGMTTECARSYGPLRTVPGKPVGKPTCKPGNMS